jgi:hypothetical protein
MLIVNSKILQKDLQKGHELFEYWKEYEKGIRDLSVRFPDGVIQLKRKGYPRDVPPHPANAPDFLMPPDAPPIFMRLTKSVDGVLWSYVKGRPKIGANGLVEPNPTEDSETLLGEVMSLNLKKDADYAFFFWYKSGQIGSNFDIYDPAGDEVREARSKKDEMRVKALIWNDFDDNKVKLMCEAYGISISARNKEIDVDILRQRLEDKVFDMEAKKKSEPTNLMLKGIADFMADAKADEFTRPKAIIQRAIDEKVLTYKGAHFYMGDLEICFVPLDHQTIDRRQEYLAKYFRTNEDDSKWVSLLEAVVDREYIDSCDKYGVRWLAEQVGIRLNQQVDAIKQQVYEKFGVTVEADAPEGTAD